MSHPIDPHSGGRLSRTPTTAIPTGGAHPGLSGAAQSAADAASGRSYGDFDPESVRGKWRFVVYSIFGLFMFFAVFSVNGKSSIPVDHVLTFVRWVLGPAVPFVVLALVAFGTVRPFVTGRWNANPVRIVFSVLNILGLVVAAFAAFGRFPGPLSDPAIGDFLWNKLAIPVGMLIPIGGVFLAFLVGYGLMEFLGVMLQRVMRPLWRVPGRSAVDAVASFVGSYSLGLLITDRVYREGRYTGREAAIIATGFSTVSATFMIIVAGALGLMDHWLLYFFVSLFVTFLVSIITVWIPPLSLIPTTTYEGVEHKPEPVAEPGNRLRTAWTEAMRTLHQTPSLPRNVWSTLKDGTLMSASIIPSILSVGLIGLLLAKFTPIFDWIGYLFYPFAWIVQLPDPLLAGKASAVGIAEMFLPAGIVGDHESLVLRFVIGVVSVSAIIFFSGMVPAVLATEIPLKLWHFVVIWFERVALSILIATPIAHLLL
ncbi:YjiH family protein [Helcobacillus massiliensis]|uniref:YjiH family protein n=1 Tax=Helcobacillus massiliensis TaxID=521392 RepID=UPI0021A9779B|nr:YjiH family protein [Helcobacillus massiliensis]MCT1558538.1 YjiH family protein [Helcobacillus massiliensis]MCT2036077.1 YjiH family protein [Helcobacillus massiliensis]MCT2332777.1 YjiH family protein [Helcobacillus massiliensis]